MPVFRPTPRRRFDFELCEAALFTQAPSVGSTNPPGEVQYAGYRRVGVLFDSHLKQVTHIEFPPSEQDAVVATNVAVFDGSGLCVGTYALRGKDVRKGGRSGSSPYFNAPAVKP